MRNKNVDMLNGPLLGSVITYTIPIILTGILQLLFNAADLIVVGRFCGSTSVAAVGATGSLINLLVNLFMGLSVGAGITTAHAIGAKNDKLISRTVHTAIPTAIICGVFLTVFGVVFAEKILALMATPEAIIELSAVYVRIYFAGILPILLYNFGAAILRAAGDTRSPLIFLTISGVINVLLNVVFVTLIKLDVAGVALATTISQFIACILVILTLMRRTDACRLEIKKLRIYSDSLKRILRMGIPAGIQSSCFALSNVLIQSSLNSFGAVVVSGASAAGNIEGFVYVTMNAFQQTALNFTGQNSGAGNYKRVRSVIKVCLVSVSVVGIILGGLVFLFAKPLLSIYITDSSEAIRWGILRMSYVCLPYFLCGIMDVSSGAMRGIGAALTPMIITLLGACGFRVLWIYTVFRIEKLHTLPVLYISYPISWALTFIALMTTFTIIYKRRIKKLQSQKENKS